jgi:streptogramin lyase
LSERHCASVSRLDPATGRLTAGITVGMQPASIAIGAGYLWETNYDGTISRIDPGRVAIQSAYIHLPTEN